MVQSFKPTSSKSLFAGRAEELQAFDDILNGRRPEWIVHVPGPGGLGKTRLLDQMRDRSTGLSDVLVTDRLIDFYVPSNQTGFGMLQSIVTQLGSDHFPRFSEERQRYERLLVSEPEPDQRKEAADMVFAAFLDDVEKLLSRGYRIVLLFDTCEEMRGAEPWLIDWLLTSILDLERRLHEERLVLTDDDTVEIGFQTKVVIAGRKHIDFTARAYAAYVNVMGLSPLTLAEMTEVFRAGGLDTSQVNDKELNLLHERSGGLPLYVALVFDWLMNEVGTIEDLLAEGTTPFTTRLIVWLPRRLRQEQGRAILYSALAWRRMEPSLMARLLEIEKEVEAEEVLFALTPFSFVKYRPPAPQERFRGSFQLHDEMRDLILREIWPMEGHQTQKEILKIIVAWYEARIGPELLAVQRRPQDTAERTVDEERSLLAEYLYYHCQLELEQGVSLHRKIFEYVIYYQDLGFAEMLNQELMRFRRDLPTEERDRLDNSRALVAFRREDSDKAQNLWRSLLRRNDLAPQLQAFVQTRLAALRAYKGDPDESHQLADQAIQLYEQLIDQAHSDEEKQRLRGDLAQAYNNRGFAYRMKGQYDDARKDYARALELPCHRKDYAKTLNNLGYVNFLMGFFIRARSEVGQALQIRRNLGIPYELGFGYNTMGLIMEQSGRVDEAADLYRKALHAMEEARSERGRATVLQGRGRLNRVVNNFGDAETDLLNALAIADSKGNRDLLIGVLNELGCVYRQRGEPGDWKKAEELLERSLAISEELGRVDAQADNWEDLSILYYRWWRAERKLIGEDEAAELLKRSQSTAEKAVELAQERSILYLEAKANRTLGGIAFERGHHDEAFDHYLDACLLMARVQLDQAVSQSHVQIRRRFEEMADRLQERLQQLDPDETIAQVDRLLPVLKRQDHKVQQVLVEVRLYLETARSLAVIIKGRDWSFTR